jgi:hypothetical protein
VDKDPLILLNLIIAWEDETERRRRMIEKNMSIDGGSEIRNKNKSKRSRKSNKSWGWGWKHRHEEDNVLVHWYE